MISLETILKRAHYKRFRAKVMFLQQAIQEWYKKNKREFQWREALDWKNGLITEILLQRTRATKVTEVFDTFFSEYPDFSSLCIATQEDVSSLISILGLHEQRAKRIIEIACKLRDYDQYPSLELLLGLKGVGNYVANATLCFYLGESRPLLDTNFRRVYSRYFGVEIPESLKQKLSYQFIEKIIPKLGCDLFSYGILDLAFLVCNFTKPKCDCCPLNSICQYAKKKS